MRESMWGIFIIVIGAVGIIAINLFQRLTVTDANTYVLMKESTKAAMYDSIDIAYFRNTGNVKIIEEKFVENFTRRFAESAVINTNYKIVVHDIVEYPPKVSLSILTDLDDMKNNEYKVLQTIDSIFETVYSRAEFYDRFGVHSEEWFPGSQIWDGTPIDPVEENFCKNAKTDIDECISGDLQFLRWEELERTVLQICDTELGKLGPKDRDAFYQECICGKWSEEKFKTINSGRPRIKDSVATYTWNFKKDGPVNDIDETVTDKIIGAVCLRDLKILKKDDLPRTNLGGIECGPDGVVVMVGQSIELYPRYIPNNAVNRNLNWEIVSGASHLNLIPISQLYFPYPQKDIITVLGVSKGETVVSAIPVDNPSGIKAATCLVKVLDKPDFSCPPSKQILVGSTFWPTIIKGKDFPVDYTLTYDVFNKTLASYDSSTDLITGLNPGSTNYIATVTIDGKSYSELCPFEVTQIIPKPVNNPTCHPYTIIIDTIQNSESASFLNPSKKPVSNYSLFNTAYLNINSSTGLMTVKNRPESDRYLSFRVTFNDSTYLDCPVMLAGTVPPPTGECNVGELRPLWSQSYIDVKPVCQETKDLEFKTAQAIASRSVIHLPIQECGRTGTISGCKGSWHTTTYSYTGEATLYPVDYNVRFNPIYSYSNWPKATLPCSGVNTKGNIDLVSKYSAPQSVLTSKKTPYTIGGVCLLFDTGGDPNAYFLADYSYPTEIVPGLEGSDRIVYHVMGGTGAKVPTASCKKISGLGSIEQKDSWTWRYVAPDPYPAKGGSFTFECSTAQDQSLKRVDTIILNDTSCGSYSLQVNPDQVWAFPSSQSGTAKLILNNNSDLKVENPYVSIWSYSGLVTMGGNSNTAISRNIYASGAGSGYATIYGQRQAYGACSDGSLLSYSLYACKTAEYYCPEVIYSHLDGNICYSSDTEETICDFGTGGTQFLDNGNCYDLSSLTNSKLVPATCSGTYYWTISGTVCASKTATPKVRSCNNPYTLYVEEDICILKRTSTKKYKYSGTDYGDSVSSTYRFSTSSDALKECKNVGLKGCSTSSETTYNCDKDPEIYGGITYCTQQPTMYCPTDRTYYDINGSCYAKIEETSAYRTCEPGKYVLNNTKCLPLNTPIATGVACPEGYAKIKDTDTFCVNKSDYRSARLTCPGYGSSSSGGGLTK